MRRFLERNKVGNSIRLYREAVEVDVQNVTKDMIKFCKKTSIHNPKIRFQ